MKAPIYQRMEALEAAIQAAGHELADPIEGLEVTREGIVAWAQCRFILLDYRWNQGYGDGGAPLPGSGNWSAAYVKDCDATLLREGGRNTSRPWWRLR
jgi:hypothetical protein